MLDQCRLDLGRRDKHAADLQHVVAAAAIDVIAVRVLEIFVAGAGPGADKGSPAALAIVPIADRAGRAADEQIADLTLPHRLARLVDDL